MSANPQRGALGDDGDSTGTPPPYPPAGPRARGHSDRSAPAALSQTGSTTTEAWATSRRAGVAAEALESEANKAIALFADDMGGLAPASEAPGPEAAIRGGPGRLPSFPDARPAGHQSRKHPGVAPGGRAERPAPTYVGEEKSP